MPGSEIEQAASVCHYLKPPSYQPLRLATCNNFQIVVSLTSMTYSLPELLRSWLQANANLLAGATDHGTLVGGARERALGALFRSLLPRRYEVLTGTIVSEDAAFGDKTHRQFDLIIADTSHYPMLLRDGDIAIAPPQSVRAVIEVKSDLASGSKFFSSIEQCASARAILGTMPAYVALYCYRAPSKSSTLRSWLNDLVNERTRLSGLLADDTSLRAEAKSRHKLTTEPTDEQLSKTRLEVAHEEGSYLAARLPDLIASDDGAVAIKDSTGDRYEFFEPIGSQSSTTIFATQVLANLTKSLARGQNDMLQIESTANLITNLLGGAPLQADAKAPSLQIS